VEHAPTVGWRGNSGVYEMLKNGIKMTLKRNCPKIAYYLIFFMYLSSINRKQIAPPS
jgi:hypothetical protein